MTATHEAVLAYIVRYCFESGGAPPGYREIMADCGLASTSTVHRVVNALEKAGELGRSENGVVRVIGAKWRPPTRLAWALEEA